MEKEKIKTSEAFLTKTCGEVGAGFSEICLLVLLFIIGLTSSAESQNDSDISLDLILSPQLSRTQVLSLANLGVSSSGSGSSLMTLVLRNNGQSQLDDLFFFITLRSANFGTITELVQRDGFFLQAFQTVVADNNQLQKGLPGVESIIRFDTGPADRTEEFINSLDGSTSLPDDLYTILVEIRKGGSRGRTLVRVERSVGAEPISQGVDLFLLQPGSQVGSKEQIATPYPIFRWDGPQNLDYRLIVVRDVGQSPEGLLQAALSTEPSIRLGRASLGSLLNFEHVDAVTKGTSFTMPPNGVQSLQAGETYFWQVFTSIKSSRGTTLIPSTIWEFTLSDPSENNNSQVDEQINLSVSQLIGEDRLKRLLDSKFKLVSVEMDGNTVTGKSSMAMQIRQILELIEQGEIKIKAIK